MSRALLWVLEADSNNRKFDFWGLVGMQGAPNEVWVEIILLLEAS